MSTSTDHGHDHAPKTTWRRSHLLQDSNAPKLTARWFHSTDQPLHDPIVARRAATAGQSSAATPPRQNPKQWVPFSIRDSTALEKAYQNNDVRAKVPVNEDYLFDVDVPRRTLCPVYWEGPTFEVRRATWFIQSDGSKWIPCEESLAEQIEEGYCEQKPYLVPETSATSGTTSVPTTSSADGQTATQEGESSSDGMVEEKLLEAKLEAAVVEKQWNLAGPYDGQYIVYTGHSAAWLLSNTPGSKIAKSIITRLTNRNNLGGTRLIRGYQQVEIQNKTAKASAAAAAASHAAGTTTTSSSTASVSSDEPQSHTKQESTDQSDVPSETDAATLTGDSSEAPEREINHLVLIVHGIGQKMSERLGQNFVHDVNLLRKTIHVAFPSATSGHKNGVQVLPILWRNEITFGSASDQNDQSEADMGMHGQDDGCPTLEEITLEGVPNIRMVVSDVLLDIPLYMTAKYRDQMTGIIAREMNRVYRLFIERNPSFKANNGKVSLLGHSLGSLLAFEILTAQPFEDETEALAHERFPVATNIKALTLEFPVQNFFAVGSPLGIILLLRGFKIESRKGLVEASSRSYHHRDASDIKERVLPCCYPAVENLYNVFHKSDPIAYRLEPLIARHYSTGLKPASIPYTKGGLKSMIDAGFNVGSGIATRASTMYESIKTGWTRNVMLRPFGRTADAGPDGELEEEPDTQGHIRQRPQSDYVAGTRSLVTKTSSDSLIVSSSPVSASSPPTALSSHNSQCTSAAVASRRGAARLKHLNPTGRVDYCLQEGLLENAYLSAFSAHMNYWQDLDVAGFLVHEIYRHP